MSGASSRSSSVAARTKPKKKAPPKSNAYLASLHAATLRGDSKALLPAEIIAQILDFLPVPDLIRWSRTSKRMQEMVYDDTRWIQKLKLVGCWNDAEARQRAEESMRRKLEAQRSRDADEARRTGVELPLQANGTSGRQKPSLTLFDASQEVGSEGQQPKYDADRLSRNFNAVSLSGPANASARGSAVETPPATEVLNNVRSIRGHARQEFGRVYAALAPFYYDLVRAKNHAEPRIFNSFKDPLHQAKMLAQLRRFSQCDTSQGCSQREEALESMIAIFENAALREFETGYEIYDIDGAMRKYAHVLVALNGGAAAIDLYIHNHALMTGKQKLGHPLACLEGSVSGQADLRPGRDFFQKLSQGIVQEISTVERVFPDSVDVLTPFLDRVAEDIISEYVTVLLDEVHSGNKESYLKLVAGTFEQAIQFSRTIAAAKEADEEFGKKAIESVNRCFEPHADLYLQEELEFFKNKSTSEANTWERRLSAQEASAESYYMSNINRQAVKKDFMASFKKVVMMPVNVLPSMSSPFTTTKPATTDSVATSRAVTPTPESSIDRAATPTPKGDAPTTELAAKAALMNSKLEGISTLFSIELALDLVHTAKASLERTALFAQIDGYASAAAKDQCRAIFVHLVEVLGFNHLKHGFDKAVGHLSMYSARGASEHGQAGVRPLVTFLELVNVGDLIQQMVDVFYTQELVSPKLVAQDDFLDPAVKQKKRFEQLLDERVAAGLNKGIDVLMDEVEYICATTQDANDFRPGAGSSTSNGADRPIMTDIGPTATSQQVVELVSSHTDMLTGSTDKTMLDVFNQEVGLRLFAALCKHLKRQRVSTDGAIKLIADTNLYFSYAQKLRIKDLLPYFMALRELSHIFLVEGKDAKELATIIADGERYHGVFRVEEVLEFAERRADWYQIRGNVERAMYGLGCNVM